MITTPHHSNASSPHHALDSSNRFVVAAAALFDPATPADSVATC